jgi:hypothetical protein
VELTAATLTTVGPWPTLRVTDHVPSGLSPVGAPLTVTLAPGAALPEILTSPEPRVTVLRMLTFAPDWFVGCSLPFGVREIGLDDRGAGVGPGPCATGLDAGLLVPD